MLDIAEERDFRRGELLEKYIVKMYEQDNYQDCGQWTLFYFLSFHFILFFFQVSFNFLFLEQLGLGVISHAVTSVTN